ncbi:MAG TPA: hypothetical protein VKC35_15105, partial [Vicinamibacterales bacterium]|nr:hypothetical protein [Vicinamibacterales bacterium]
MKSRPFAAVPALVVLVCSLAFAQSNGQPERFTANAVSLSPEYGTGQQTVEMTINRWSPNAERTRLVTLLQEKGPNELLKQLQKIKPVGRIRTPDSIGYDLRYAQQTPSEDGGRTIVIATDRPIGFWEATQRPRSIDYPFTVIQMKLDRDGNGSGTLSYATRIVARGNNVIELEDFATQPIMLNNIKAATKNATR